MLFLMPILHTSNRVITCLLINLLLHTEFRATKKSSDHSEPQNLKLCPNFKVQFIVGGLFQF